MAAPNPLEQIRAFFTRYTLQQKLMLAGSGALVLVLLWALVFFMNRVEYQTLYADLDPQEAQSIMQKLQELKVQYELGPDGRTVKVAADKIAEVRIQMASQGLPESGFEQVAVQPELIDGVQNAAALTAGMEEGFRVGVHGLQTGKKWLALKLVMVQEIPQAGHQEFFTVDAVGS